jgi:hypothetical protein
MANATADHKGLDERIAAGCADLPCAILLEHCVEFGFQLIMLCTCFVIQKHYLIIPLTIT